MCHRAEGMAPMSLSNFSDVRPWVRSIKRKVEDRDDAAVVRRQDGRHPEVRQRPVAVRPRDRSDLAMGRRRRAAGGSARSAHGESLAGRRRVGVRRILRTSARPRREVARLLDAGRVAGPVVGGARHAGDSRGPLGRRDRDPSGQALAQSRASRDDDVVPEGNGRNARFRPVGAQRQGRSVRAVPERQGRGSGHVARSDAVRPGVLRMGRGQERRALRRARGRPVPARRLGARLGHPHERVG